MSGDRSPYEAGKKRHPAKRYLDEAPELPAVQGPAFVELCACSNFSFLYGASHADDMVAQAGALGLKGLVIADRNTFAGVVRAHAAARRIKEARPDFQFIPGVRLIPYAPGPTRDADPIQTGPEIVTLPRDRAAYGRLCKLLTKGNRAAPKGRCYLSLDEICDAAEGQIAIVVPPRKPTPTFTKAFRRDLGQIKTAFGDHCYLAATRPYGDDDGPFLKALAKLGVPLIASNDALYHTPGQRKLQDVVTCIRTHQLVSDAGFDLKANAERHLKSGAEMLRLFQGYEEAVYRSTKIAALCNFSLDELKYEYPDEAIGPGKDPQASLEQLTWEGAAKHYPDGVPDHVRTTLEKELRLIKKLDYARYFLTVYDSVRFARSQDILCQGRGSAANSAVCFVTGITAVNPIEVDLLFERFISEERGEPPDIDVDFEHERREEVVQYIYNKYGRHRAGIAATVISYRWKSAIREVGKVMGLSEDVTGVLSKLLGRWVSSGEKGNGEQDEMIREAGLDPADPLLQLTVELADQLQGFPRHLSQHVGGFVMTRGALEEVVPIHNAAMDDRTFVEWDKDDLDALGMLKVDVLSLGMLTCIRKCFTLIEDHYDRPLTLATLPREDTETYDMICKADTIGTFQIESRAQMSMLPRLRPREFYDLVVEVAIVRPGPIQGDMVHPYLRRRDGIDPIEYAIPELEPVLKKTHGVPLFQEQAMKIAIVGADFTPDEADQLRRAMATFRHNGTIYKFEEKLVEGLVAKGADRDFAQRCFEQIKGFGDYGFPESHAASFALLAYASCWLKCHYPAAFACALLNSQPMGFYAPAQIVRDARDHGVTVLPPDVNISGWDSSLERGDDSNWALRLGLRQIKGFKKEAADRLVERRGKGYDSVRHLQVATGLDCGSMEKLAEADSFTSIGLNRRDALWAVQGFESGETPPLFEHIAAKETEEDANLPPMTLGEQVVHDYRTIRLSLKAHPLALLSDKISGRTPSWNLPPLKTGRRIRVAGLVLNRQRPGTAQGVIFMTLEDETGPLNIIVWARTFEKFRRDVLTGYILEVEGELQNENGVIHIVANHIWNRNDLFTSLMEAEDVPANLSQSLPGALSQPVPHRHPRNAADLSALLPKSRDFH